MTALSFARRLADWMDRRYVDPLLGLLVPEVGDFVSTSFGLYVVGVAWKEGVPLPVLARMLLNLGVDALVGAIPILGDLFDFVFKAHTRNLALLEARLPARRTTAADWAILVGAIAFLVGGFVAMGFAAFYLLRWLFDALTFFA